MGQKIFKEIMAETFSELMKDTKTVVQKVQGKPTRINNKEYYPDCYKPKINSWKYLEKKTYNIQRNKVKNHIRLTIKNNKR